MFDGISVKLANALLGYIHSNIQIIDNGQNLDLTYMPKKSKKPRTVSLNVRMKAMI